MTEERILDIITKTKDYAGPLYKYELSKEEKNNNNQDDAEIRIIDVFDIGTDSAVVLWKRKSRNMARFMAMATLIVDGRIQSSMQAREYMRGINIRIENGDHRINLPASAAGYLLYLDIIGASYKWFDKEFDENGIERPAKGKILDILEDHFGHRPTTIYSTCPIGGTGTLAVEFPIKKEDFDSSKPMVNFAIISGDKVIVTHTLPAGAHHISYATPNGEMRKVRKASNYADMWLSYGAANKDSMQKYIDDAIEKAYTEKDEVPADSNDEEYAAE